MFHSYFPYKWKTGNVFDVLDQSPSIKSRFGDMKVPINAVSAVFVTFSVSSFKTFDDADAAVREFQNVPPQSKSIPGGQHLSSPDVICAGGDCTLDDLKGMSTPVSSIEAQFS